VATTFAPRPTRKLDTTSNTPVDPELIEVTELTHPLFGRRFQLVSRHDAAGNTAHNAPSLLVIYRDSIFIRLPLAATNLSSAIGTSARTKFDAEAVEQLLAFVKECEQPCPADPKPSGRRCPNRSGGKSPKTSFPSSRR
jgi:hypothetical protein